MQVTSVQVHPLDSHTVLTASNDHSARISDVRCLSTAVTVSSGSSAGAPLPFPTLRFCYS